MAGAVTDGLKNILLAGIGALAITGEKGKELIDTLVEKGELTVEQGKEINAELTHRVSEVATAARDTALEARMKAMTPEEREAFVEKVTRMAAEQSASAQEVSVEPVNVENIAQETSEEPKEEKPASDGAASE